MSIHAFGKEALPYSLCYFDKVHDRRSANSFGNGQMIYSLLFKANFENLQTSGFLLDAIMEGTDKPLIFWLGGLFGFGDKEVESSFEDIREVSAAL